MIAAAAAGPQRAQPTASEPCPTVFDPGSGPLLSACKGRGQLRIDAQKIRIATDQLIAGVNGMRAVRRTLWKRGWHRLQDRETDQSDHSANRSEKQSANRPASNVLITVCNADRQ